MEIIFGGGCLPGKSVTATYFENGREHAHYKNIVTSNGRSLSNEARAYKK